MPSSAYTILTYIIIWNNNNQTVPIGITYIKDRNLQHGLGDILKWFFVLEFRIYFEKKSIKVLMKRNVLAKYFFCAKPKKFSKVLRKCFKNSFMYFFYCLIELISHIIIYYLYIILKNINIILLSRNMYLPNTKIFFKNYFIFSNYS